MYVVDHLGISSEVKYKSIERAESSQPLLVDIGDDVVDWQPDRQLMIRAHPIISECANIPVSAIEVSFTKNDNGEAAKLHTHYTKIIRFDVK